MDLDVTGRTKESFWELGDIFRLAGLYMLVLITGTMLLTWLLGAPHELAKTIAFLAVMAVHRRFLFWPGAEYFALRWTDFRAHFKMGFWWGMAAKMVPIVLAVVIMIPLVSIMGDSLPEIEIQPNHDAGVLAPFSLAWIITAFGLVILAPVVEELFIRGVLYGFLRNKWGVRMAIFASSVVFALLHGFGLILIPTFIGGVIFAMLYERTGSLAPCIIAHSTFNLVAVIASTI